jgi:molybdopterin-containing oxidoreductase family iron-sulfur binding subunit
MTDNTSRKDGPSIADIRARLEAKRGPEYWRSLDELAETEEFRQFLHNEFPALSGTWGTPVNRREILKLMGASLALAGLSACAQPPKEKIVPYAHAPEELVPGKPLFFATAMPLGGYGRGLLVESHTGRPTKVEGNPQHPASLGATDAYAQASVLSLYDPDRSSTVTFEGRVTGWSFFMAALEQLRETQRIRKGSGLRILTETVTSPSLSALLEELLREFPAARWHQYEPAGSDGARAGAVLAFGEYVRTCCRVDKADVILALDADFLQVGPASLRYAREWASRRRAQLGPDGMNRLYAVETTPSNTGAVADHRLALRPSEFESFVREVARGIGVEVQSIGSSAPQAKWIDAIVRDLKQHQGSSLVIAGEYQPAAVHALAHAMNQALGNAGKTVFYTDPVEVRPADHTRSLAELVADMNAGKVELLVILGANPVFTAPADIDFAQSLGRVPARIHLSLYEDETSRFCNWHVPAAHYLEAWGDIRAYDGTTTIIQPLIAPLYDGKSELELLAAYLGKQEASGYEIVREFWRARDTSGNFEHFWRQSLNDGVVAGTALPPKPVTLKPEWTAGLASSAPAQPQGLEICFRPDPSIYDGRFANNGWLQELPKSLTKLTWDNAALLSPATAQKLNLAQREKIEIRYRGRSVIAPVWLLPGHPHDCLTVHFGYGRTSAGRVGTGAGFNAYAIRTSDAPWFGDGVQLVRTGGEMALSCTQDHFLMEGRNLVLEATIAEYLKNPRFAKEMGEEPPRDLTLYPEWEYSGYKWAMSVNLASCIGCNACVVACEAENNSPVVGKVQVGAGREMQWLRIDRYFKGDLDNPSIHFQPVLCMQCENAPCEVVCPVAATSHSSEGLNQMVYNRCVGTRYCSNNCPYKVRRFNFLQYSDWDTPSLKPLRNPDVSVRGRGVMEKCTYCVQRIQEAKIRAEEEDRPVRDGEIVTACQAACPTQAFVFGNLNEPGSRVARLVEDPLNYGLLAELNTRPRTTYQAKVRNPNPELEREER